MNKTHWSGPAKHAQILPQPHLWRLWAATSCTHTRKNNKKSFKHHFTNLPLKAAVMFVTRAKFVCDI